MSIPAIGVESDIGTVVSEHRGSAWVIQPPESTPEELNRVYWWSEHAAPGLPNAGTSYLLGHACAETQCVFNDLHTMTVGDEIVVTVDGAAHRYVVDREPMSFGKNAEGIGSSTVYDYSVDGRLVLITCGYGPDNSSNFNWVVFANLTT